MNGLHLIGDLTGCRCDPQLLLDGERFRAKCLEMVAESGLTTMDSTFHTFEGGGFTGTVVLAESHLAIHTWPERQGLTLLGLAVGNLEDDTAVQLALPFDRRGNRALDAALDEVRQRFGSKAITRAVLLGRELEPWVRRGVAYARSLPPKGWSRSRSPSALWMANASQSLLK